MHRVVPGCHRVPLTVGVTIAAVTLAANAVAQTSTPPCRTWQACRDQSRDAAARGEYETAHDLAWRAIQQAVPRAEDLMLLLARMQSLSGRPDDALVMLRRLAEAKGVATEALTSEDFRRVRERPGWPEVEAMIRRNGADTPTVAPTPAPAPPTPEPVPTSPTPDTANAAMVGPATPARGVRSATPPADARSTAPTSAAVEDAFRFRSPQYAASALAVDRVSSRFLIGSRADRKVIAVGEQTHRAVDLVRADSAQFFDVMCLDIDRRRGDLWVASSEPPRNGGDPATSDGSRSAIHRLQLISGRPLALLPVTSADGVRLVDLAVTTEGGVLALDAPGRRIWAVKPGHDRAEVVALLDARKPRALALSPSGRRVYVAHERGLVAIELANEGTTALTASDGLPLEGLERLRATSSALTGVQRDADGRPRIVRLDLDRAGTRVIRREVLDDTLAPGSAAPALTLLGNELFYATPSPGGGASAAAPADAVETLVRRVTIK